MDSIGENTKQVEKKKSNRKKIAIFTLIALIVSDICFILTIIFIRHDNESNSKKQASEYNVALKWIANNEYKLNTSKVDDENYIDSVCSYVYNVGTFIYTTNTNFEIDNQIIEIKISGSQLSSLNDSLEFIKNNYTDLSSINIDVVFYKETTILDESFLDYVAEVQGTENPKSRVFKTYVSSNTNYVRFSLSYYKDKSLHTALGKYDLINSKSEELITYSEVGDLYIDIIDF